MNWNFGTGKILALGLLVGSTAAVAQVAAPSTPTVGLSTHLVVDTVNIPQRHLSGAWRPWGERTSCSAFKGTFEGSTVHLHAEATGGSGNYEHSITTLFNNSYKLSNKETVTFQDKRRGNGNFKIKLPDLTDEVPFVQQSVLLTTKDSAGNVATQNFVFTVSRPVILSPSADAQAQAKNCFERYAPYESMTGVLSNATNNLSTIQIRQGIQKLWTSTRGWQWGVFVSPLAATVVANLLTINFSYFQETSKTVSETTEVSTEYSFDPGDYMQVYVQPTRYVTAYDATLVDPCGAMQKSPGAYSFQWWGFAYHVAPVNPYSTERPSTEAIGAPVLNSCGADFSPDATTAQTDKFWRTN
jgi:hypothetical protein